MKKISLCSILIISMLALVACGGGGGNVGTSNTSESIALTAGHSSPEGISVDKSVKEAAENIKEKSSGNIEITIYPSGQLGGDREQIEATQFGDQDIWKGASSALVPFIGEFAVFDMPMIFTDYNHEQINQVLSGEVGDFREKLNQKTEENGLVLLSLSSNNTYRTMSSNIPVETIDDFDGVRIRTMENNYHLQFWNDVGASPTPVNFSELYVALQQGVVDAQENPVVGLVGSGQYEQQKYITDTNHLLTVSCVVMNKAKFDSLSEEQQKLIYEFADENAELEYKYGMEEYDAMKKVAEDSGIEFISLSDETKGELKNRAEGTIELVKNDLGEDIVNSLFDSLEQTK